VRPIDINEWRRWRNVPGYRWGRRHGGRACVLGTLLFTCVPPPVFLFVVQPRRSPLARGICLVYLVIEYIVMVVLLFVLRRPA
jgi:hypothetical protein